MVAFFSHLFVPFFFRIHLFVLSLSKVIWIVNCSLEVDLSKELSAPVNHNLNEQTGAATDVRKSLLPLTLT